MLDRLYARATAQRESRQPRTDSNLNVNKLLTPSSELPRIRSASMYYNTGSSLKDRQNKKLIIIFLIRYTH